MTSHNGVIMRLAGVKSQVQIGRFERHGGLGQNVYRRIIADRDVAGPSDVRSAVAEATNVKSALSRNGGLALRNGIRKSA